MGNLRMLLATPFVLLIWVTLLVLTLVLTVAYYVAPLLRLPRPFQLASDIGSAAGWLVQYLLRGPRKRKP